MLVLMLMSKPDVNFVAHIKFQGPRGAKPESRLSSRSLKALRHTSEELSASLRSMQRTGNRPI